MRLSSGTRFLWSMPRSGQDAVVMRPSKLVTREVLVPIEVNRKANIQMTVFSKAACELSGKPGVPAPVYALISRAQCAGAPREDSCCWVVIQQFADLGGRWTYV